LKRDLKKGGSNQMVDFNWLWRVSVYNIFPVLFLGGLTFGADRELLLARFCNNIAANS
jgi:hypothetical protein